jgi:hypothetical protein
MSVRSLHMQSDCERSNEISHGVSHLHQLDGS